MGNPNTAPAGRAYGVQDAQEFGMIGLLSGSNGLEMGRASNAPAAMVTSMNGASASAAPVAIPPAANRFGDDINDGNFGLNGAGPGGGGRGEGIGLDKLGGLGHGHGHAGAADPKRPPTTKDAAPHESASNLHAGEATVTGSLPSEVVQRIVRAENSAASAPASIRRAKRIPRFTGSTRSSSSSTRRAHQEGQHLNHTHADEQPRRKVRVVRRAQLPRAFVPAAGRRERHGRLSTELRRRRPDP